VGTAAAVKKLSGAFPRTWKLAFVPIAMALSTAVMVAFLITFLMGIYEDAREQDD
jgi:hypothetical protein